jgi:zinc protease
VAERAFLRLLYGAHPYGHLAIGTSRRSGRSRRGRRAFHAATFRPERAVLVAVGAMPHDGCAGSPRRPSAPGRPGRGGRSSVAAADIDPASGPARLAIVPRDGAAQSELRIGHLAARRSTPDYPPLLVMNAVLGGQFVSRVNLKLREEKGFTYGARTGFDWRRGLAPFSLQASVHTAATAEAIRDVPGRAVRDPRARGRRRTTSSRSRGVADARLSRNFETAQQVARSVAQLALYDLPDTYFEEFVPRVNAITVDDVTRVAARYLDPSRLVTLVVGDACRPSRPWIRSCCERSRTDWHSGGRRGRGDRLAPAHRPDDRGERHRRRRDHPSRTTAHGRDRPCAHVTAGVFVTRGQETRNPCPYHGSGVVPKGTT